MYMSLNKTHIKKPHYKVSNVFKQGTVENFVKNFCNDKNTQKPLKNLLFTMEFNDILFLFSEIDRVKESVRPYDNRADKERFLEIIEYLYKSYSSIEYKRFFQTIIFKTRDIFQK